MPFLSSSLPLEGDDAAFPQPSVVDTGEGAVWVSASVSSWSRELFPHTILLPHYLGLSSILPSSSTFPFLLPWQQVDDSWREDAAPGGAFKTGNEGGVSSSPRPRSAREVSAEGQLCTLVPLFSTTAQVPSISFMGRVVLCQLFQSLCLLVELHDFHMQL